MQLGISDGLTPLANELVAWRENAGLSQRELASKIPWSSSYVAMVERCERLPSVDFTNACDELFGTPGTLSRMREHVAKGLSGHPDWFTPYVRAESEASEILDYSNSFFFGVFQTRDYAQAIFRAAHPHVDEEIIEGKVNARLERSAVLVRPRPPMLWTVIDESALRRVVGGPNVMHDQLEQLLSVSQGPHVTVQVLPFSDGAGCPVGPLDLLTMPDAQRLLYVQQPYLGVLVDNPTRVSEAQRTYDQLRAHALSPKASLRFMKSISEEYAP